MWLDLLKEAHKRLIKLIKLIKRKYEPEKITLNLHLSLHLCECSYDYGPLYSFWCFSFERMNGILGSLPNSNQKIEPELMRRLLNDYQIVNLTASLPDEKGLDLLKNQPSIGSLSDADEFSSDKIY